MSSNELHELRSIKKLLVLQLLHSGISGRAIARLLEMDAGDFSRKFPVKKLIKQYRKIHDE